MTRSSIVYTILYLGISSSFSLCKCGGGVPILSVVSVRNL